MVSTLKENPNGGFYCSECRMSTSDPVEICPFCGSVISNWMDIIVKQENDRIRSLMDIDPETGKNKYAEDPDIIIGGRWYETPVEEIGPPLIDEKIWNELITIIKENKENESDLR